MTVIDEAGQLVDRWGFAHTEAGWTAAPRHLAGQGEPASLPVIIERTSELIVDRLLAAGIQWCPCVRRRFMLSVRAGARVRG